MKKKRAGRQKGRVYSFLLVSYISVLVLTLSSSLVFYARMNRQITQQTQRTSDLLLTQVRENWEQNTGEMERLVNELASNYLLEQYAKGSSTVSTAEVRNLLATIRGKDSNFLMDKVLYFSADETVLSATQSMPARQFFTVNYPPEGVSYPQLEDALLQTSHFRHYLPVQTVNLYLENTDVQVLPFVQSFPVSINRPVTGHIVCMIDVASFSALMEQINTTTGSHVYILNKDGQVVLQNTNAPLLDAEALQKYAEGNGLAGSIVTQQESSRGWTFLLATPTRLYNAENRNFLLWMLLVTAAYFAVGLILVRALAERNYRPINEIVKLIQSKTQSAGEQDPDELTSIRKTLLAQYNNSDRMDEKLETQRPYVEREMLARALTGMVRDYDDWQQHLAGVGVQFIGSRFLIASVEIDENSVFFDEGKPEESRILSRLVAQNVGSELFEAVFQCRYLEMGQNLCVFLLCFADEEEADDMARQAKELTRQLVDFAQRCGVLMYAGISSVHTGLPNLTLCLDESRKAQQHGILWADKPVVEFTELEDLDLDYYYPSETEYQVISYLRTGEYEQAKQLVKTVFATNATEKSIGVNAARNLIVELDTTLGRVLDPKPDDAQAELDGLLLQPSLEAAQAWFTAQIDAVSKQRVESHAQTKTGRLAAAVAAYIREHVEDPNLDLNDLSREFGVTPQYISGIFKRYQGDSIKDYISKLRLEKAKELLRTTDMPVKEIAARLGYAGEIGIIRLFKRYDGITPGEYRNQYGGGR